VLVENGEFMNIKRINKLLSLGKTKYVFLHGVCFWGGGMALFFMAYNFLREGGWSFTAFAVALVNFPLFGILWGYWMWNRLLKMKKKADI